MVIAVVALIVIGPEKLPKVARTLGAMTGRLQRYMAQIKEEVNREARFEELQKLQQEIQQASANAEANLQASTANLLQGAAANLNQPSEVADNAAAPASVQKNNPIKD